MSTELQIYNRALDAVGARSDVNSVNEESRRAEVCRLWFSPVRNLVLRAAPWSSARAHARLALLKERDDTLEWQPDDPAPGYRYAYAVPSDMIAPRYLTTFERFELGLYFNGVTDALAIMANVATPILTYTKLQATTGLWDDGLDSAVTFALAAHICMPLTGKTSRVDLLLQQANNRVIDARLQDANASDVQFDTVPDWISARGYAGSSPSSRFIYPYGPMISVMEAAGVS